MAQPRRSARLADLSQQSSQVPVEIDLTDPDGFSDNMKEDLTPFSDVPLPPVPSCFVCDGHFASSGPLSRCVLQCCSISIHLQCVTDLVHLPSQSVVCPACNPQSPSSLDFLHFQHLCCVHHMEAPAGECMICSSPQSFASSFSVPCCRQRIHCECLARSVHSCGDHCPFCTQDLVPVLSDPLLAASFEHLNIPIDFNAPPANSSVNSLCVSLTTCHVSLPFSLCCAHICGPPDFEPLNDRRMEWSPIHPSAQGSSSDRVLQWVCRSCGSSTSMQDIPVLPAVSCPQCSSSAAIVFDRPAGRVVRFCVSCQFVVPHDGVSPPPLPSVPPAPAPPHNDLGIASGCPSHFHW